MLDFPSPMNPCQSSLVSSWCFTCCRYREGEGGVGGSMVCGGGGWTGGDG